jgi:uncharacterized protein YbjT (DUF2867 family)
MLIAVAGATGRVGSHVVIAGPRAEKFVDTATLLAILAGPTFVDWLVSAQV